MTGRNEKPLSFWWICGICWFVYASAYFGRINLSIALPALEDAWGYSKTSLGILASGFFFTYGAGQLINGALGDRYNPRYFVAAGIAAAALSNVLFVFSGNLAVMFLLWAANGYFQSMLWGPLVRIVAEHTPSKYLTRVMLFFSSSTLAGYLVSFSVIGKVQARLGWKGAFLIPGLMLLLVAAVWFFVMKRPQKSAQAPEGAPETSETRPAETSAGKRGSFRDTGRFIIRSGLWLSAFVCIVNGILKEGLGLWGPAFLTESRGLSLDKALLIMSLVPAINFLCLGLNGWVHKLCKHRAERTTLCFLAAGVFFLALLRLTYQVSLPLLILGFCGIFVSVLAANNILTAFMPLSFQKEGRVSTAAGFLDCAIYVGAAVAGPGLGALAEWGGWSWVINCWLGVSAAGVVLSVLIIRRRNAGCRQDAA